MQMSKGIIFCKEVERGFKEMRDKKATRDDDVLRDILRLLGEDGPRLMTQLINNIYETGQWPKDFIEVTVITLKKKPKGTKCSDSRTVSLIV
jgi:signal transduction protein with GAF and PtsI domain